MIRSTFETDYDLSHREHVLNLRLSVPAYIMEGAPRFVVDNLAAVIGNRTISVAARLRYLADLIESLSRDSRDEAPQAIPTLQEPRGVLDAPRRAMDV